MLDGGTGGQTADEPTGGEVHYDGKSLRMLSKTAMREQRKHLQMVFQDPYASLNPRMTVGNIIGEPIRTFIERANEENMDKLQTLCKCAS